MRIPALFVASARMLQIEAIFWSRDRPRFFQSSTAASSSPGRPPGLVQGNGRSLPIACRIESRTIHPGHPYTRIRIRLHMASLDWSHCPAVESIPGKVSGAWVFRGTRVPVSAIFENLKSSSMDEVLENFPVTRDQIQAVLDFAAKSAESPSEPSRAA